jgi:predicted glycosyltransferase
VAIRVLYGVLDWGLGHATRSIPVIELLRARGCEVHVATSGLAYELLRGEFPELQIDALPSYAVRYARHGLFMVNIFWQLPRLLSVIWREGRAARKLAREFEPDVVISDCRYGFRVRGTASIFITHQLNFQMPWTFRLLQPIVNVANHLLISRFDTVWIPDAPNGITGKLSRPGRLATKTKWIGTLSRLPHLPAAAHPTYELAVILSGPEPQRTLLEQKIISQLQPLQLRAVVVRGLPSARAYQQIDQIDVHNYLEGGPLAVVIQNSKVVIARSGYSTVMDLMALGSRAIFVPTPGQTEQELLAATLAREKIAGFMPQFRFNLATALQQLPNYRGFANSTRQPNLLPIVVDELLKDCSRD